MFVPAQRSPNLLSAFSFLPLLIAVFILVGCSDSSHQLVPRNGNGALSVTTAPIDVFNERVLKQISLNEPQVFSAALSDDSELFDNGGFENGLKSWSDCTGSEGGIAITSDAYNGSIALELSGGNCFYRSLPVTPGDELLLSCVAKVNDVKQWAGLGLGFASSEWRSLGDSSTSLVSSEQYTGYSVLGTAPEDANFVSMWFYSDSKATVDNCSLIVANTQISENSADVATPAVEWPASSYRNIIRNSDFQGTPGTHPAEWHLGCEKTGIATIANSGELQLSGSVCVAQSLSFEDIQTLRGNRFVFECSAERTSGSNEYADIVIGFDADETAQSDLVNGKFTITGVAPEDAHNGYIGIYSELNNSASLRVTACSLTVESKEENATNEADNQEDADLPQGEPDEQQPDMTEQPVPETPESCTALSLVTSDITSTRYMRVDTDSVLYYRGGYDEVWSYNPAIDTQPELVFAGSDETSAIAVSYANEDNIYFSESACQYCEGSLYRYERAIDSLERVDLGDLYVSFGYSPVFIGDKIYYRKSDDTNTFFNLWVHDENGNRQVTDGINTGRIGFLGRFIYFIATVGENPDHVYRFDTSTEVAELIYSAPGQYLYSVSPLDDGGVVIHQAGVPRTNTSGQKFIRVDASDNVTIYNFHKSKRKFFVDGDDIYFFAANNGVAELYLSKSSGEVELISSFGDGQFIDTSWTGPVQIGSNFYLMVSKSQTERSFLRFSKFGDPVEITDFQELTTAPFRRDSYFGVVRLEEQLYFAATKDEVTSLWSYNTSCE